MSVQRYVLSLNQYRTVKPCESSLSHAAPGTSDTPLDTITIRAQMKLTIPPPECRDEVAVTTIHKKQTKNSSPKRRLGYRHCSKGYLLNHCFLSRAKTNIPGRNSMI